MNFRRNKRSNNGNKKLKEIKDYIRDENYEIHEHFIKRFVQRELTHKEVRRIIFDGKETWSFNNRVTFKWKKHGVVVEFEDKDNGKVTGITLITVY